MSGGPARERRESEALGGVGGSSHQCSLAQSRRLGGDAVMRSTDELDELYMSAIRQFVWSGSMHRVFKYDHNEDDDDLVEASMQEDNLIRERCYPGLDSSASNADSTISTNIGSESSTDSYLTTSEDTSGLTDGSSDTCLTPSFCKDQDTQDTKNWRCIYKPSTNREEEILAAREGKRKERKNRCSPHVDRQEDFELEKAEMIARIERWKVEEYSAQQSIVWV